VNGNTFRTLEFEAIRTLLLSHAGSAAGAERISALGPSTERAVVRESLAVTSEAVRVLDRIGRQPHHDLPDVAELLPGARVSGAHLEPRALSDIASFIEGATEIAARVSRVETAARLARLAGSVPALREVAAGIRRAILPTGEVADDASPKLAEIRRALMRSRAQLQSVMESFLRGKEADRLLQDKVVTTRNDRYVLLLKAEHRGAVPGIIHGTSGSGASLFVEPMPAVELNNDIVGLTEDERREIVRILRDLTSRVGYRADDLAQAVEALGTLDFAQAKALAARDMAAIEPEMADDLRLHLDRARHPLLMPALAERLGLHRRSTREPVPVSLRVGYGEPVLVISGPNTGGKTVALKTAGLLALMAQSGLHVPAEPGSVLPVFQRIYADIGDDQSIAENLSTFSAHLKSISDMTRDLATPALVLLDEVGAGTDPGEGGALGVAIVHHFRERGAMVVATTHHGLLKAYAQSTPGVACASFGYDPLTYEPTYRLQLGAPGRSLALEMAERLGLPAAVVRDARARLDEKEAQAEALLKRLEDERALLTLDQERLAAERRALAEAATRQVEAEQRLADRRKADAEAFARELKKRSEDAARKAADAIQKAVQRVEAASRTSARSAATAGAKARTEAIGTIRRAQDEALLDPALALAPEPEPLAAPLAVGMRARVRRLGVIGEILALPEDGLGDAELAIGGKRLRVPQGELIALSGGGPSSRGATPAPRASRASGAPVSSELHIVGMTVDEALPLVDKRLDDAVRGDVNEVRIVHGFGHGKLRRAVADLLHDHPHVARFRSGESHEGGAGATIVELKG
jgi:DNA mismatch repair protein MutS2